MIYILVFALSCVCFYFSQKYDNDKGKKTILVLIGILIPSILAGLRDWSIGTDVNIYLVKNFNYAQNSGIADFFNTSDIEMGYGLFLYVISFFFRKCKLGFIF